MKDMIKHSNPVFIESVSKINKIELDLTVQYADNIWLSLKEIPSRLQLCKWFKAGLQQDAQATIRIVDEIEGRRYNRNFRGKDYATNVLTFIYGETLPLSADIVLCVPVIEREAKHQHKDLLAHYAHLTVHSSLHMQGYIHEKENDAIIMEKLETEIVTSLGFDDPYQEKN